MLNKNIEILNKLGPRLYFSTSTIADVLDLKPESAKVLATRYTKSGFFIRLKKDFYVCASFWQRFTRDEFLKISNLIQVPSYISFMTALSIYEITTQVPRNFYESASLKRTIAYDIKGTVFKYYKIKSELYFDFVRENDIFISTKEKAFLDTVYLYSLGRYSIDLNSLDLRKLDFRRVKKLMKVYPEKTKNIIKKICKI